MPNGRWRNRALLRLDIHSFIYFLKLGSELTFHGIESAAAFPR
jgi:hypothetical protein